MPKGHIGVGKAYCVDSGTVMNIFQARDYFFSRNPCERLRFECSDPACRNSPKAPAISGINHHASLKMDEKYVKPHFRTCGEHIQTCEWAETAVGA